MADYLTGTDVALILRVSSDTVRAMADRGDLPVAARTKSGIRLFDRAAVLRIAHEREQEKDR